MDVVTYRLLQPSLYEGKDHSDIWQVEEKIIDSAPLNMFMMFQSKMMLNRLRLCFDACCPFTWMSHSVSTVGVQIQGAPAPREKSCTGLKFCYNPKSSDKELGWRIQLHARTWITRKVNPSSVFVSRAEPEALSRIAKSSKMSVLQTTVQCFGIDNPLNAFICYSKWTSWSIFHCLIGYLTSHPYRSSPMCCFNTGHFSLHPEPKYGSGPVDTTPTVLLLIWVCASITLFSSVGLNL